GRVLRPRRVRRLGKEQQSVKGHLRDRALYDFRGVEDALGYSRAPEPRSVWIYSAIAKWREEQVMQVPALRRHHWLCALDQTLQQALLIERIDQLERRDVMLGLDDAPTQARKHPCARR